MIRDPFLKTDGIHNFRDYGGYPAAGGGRVKTGLLFRSGQHFDASGNDLAAIEALDIRTIIDLRGASERASFPCRRHEAFSGEVIAYEGETTSSPPHEAAGEAGMSAERARQRMVTVFRRMPENPAMIAMFARFLAAIDERDGGSLIHCFAGKDRTGIAATLLLHVLGVHRDDLVEEFLLTNRAPSIEVLKAQTLPRIEAIYGTLEDEAVRNLLGVRPEYVETFITTVEAAHGTLDRYLADVIGVDDARRERLRAKLVA
ncbi:MAG: protein tyrosine phosphatase [Sphingomonadales bacterium BRH_c42]|nr:MAG: protein tyrosine phosphatase [Sphingomonadales bacterium BRH_c42]